VCGERGSDNDQVIDLWDDARHAYVMLAHYDGCRQRFPEFRSDFDD